MDSLYPPNPLGSQPAGATPQPPRTTAARIARLGALRSTALLTAVSALASVALTYLWLRLKGDPVVGDSLYIALFVAVPMSAVASGVATRLVVSLEDARRRLHELAMTDPLTGLRNRRHFVQWAQRELELAQRHDLPLALLVLDIDHFKRINDQHGHAAGDDVLVEIGRRCAQALRGTDLLARWGGEEFIALLPNTPAPLAQQLGDRLRAAAAAGIQLPLGLPLTVTVSIGVAGRATGTGPAPTLDALIQAADRALYDAKRAGRDQVRMSF
jgi:diguanylate cyclase (GGDEF)-like protein